VVFSLFGKKPPPAPAKVVAKKPVVPAKPVAPAVKPVVAPETTAPEPKRELESLDFTSDGSYTVHESEPAPKAQQPSRPAPQATTQPAAQPPSSAPPLDDLTDGLLEASMELTESGGGSHQSIEETAILYANGQDAAALATLEAAVAGNLGAATDQAWAMLFDLYQLMEKRESFEQRAFEYSVKFEKSPPTWVVASKLPLNPTSEVGGQAFVALADTINAASEKQIAQLEKLVAKGPVARVEFAKVQDVDAPGAAMLLKVLKLARKCKCELVMVAAPQFIELCKRKIEVGRRDGEDVWLLLIELYQNTGEQELFEEWALNYAITFELSPPSWENLPAKKAGKPVTSVAQEEAAELEMFSLIGEMSSAGSDALQRLQDYANDHANVVIDCTGLKRMDFVSAGMFLNTLTNLQVAGKNVTLRQPNQLILGLFNVLGIDQVVHVERRKF